MMAMLRRSIGCPQIGIKAGAKSDLRKVLDGPYRGLDQKQRGA
jgi:hypothetical protein